MSAGECIPCPVAEIAARAPGRMALRTASGDVTFGAWHDLINRAAAALCAAGVGPGSRVGLCMSPGVELLSKLIALFRIGAVACPVNPAFPVSYREELLSRLDCALVIGERLPARVFTPPAPPQAGGNGGGAAGIGGGGCTSTLESDLFPPACGGVGGVADPCGGAGGANLDESTKRGATWRLDIPATIIFTSGSTGSPKAAVLSLRNHWESARCSNENIALAPGDCWLLSLPMHHVAGFGVLFRCLAAGAAIALPESGAALYDSITRPGATHVSLVARQLAQLLDRPAPALKAILLGGSAIPAPLLDRAVAAGLPVHTSYGMTETASQIAATPPGASREVLASSGRPLAPDTIRIDADGVIEVNGPARFLGYWESGEILRPFDSEGWFKTSDCAHFDDAGFLYVTGRKDNVFIAGGENIQPEEIERAICALPGVLQAIVVPVPHPEFGATVVAFVECAGTLDVRSTQDALRAVLPAFKVPRHILPWPADLAGEMKVVRSEFAKRAAEAIRG